MTRIVREDVLGYLGGIIITPGVPLSGYWHTIPSRDAENPRPRLYIECPEVHKLSARAISEKKIENVY